MLQAAAMLVGLWVVWLLMTQPALTPQQLLIGVAVAIACAALGARFGRLRELGAPIGISVLRVRRAPENFRAALRTARALLAADIALRPALVRIKPRGAGAAAKAALAAALSAGPGQIAVEADADGLLAHVLDEDAVRPDDIGAIEDGVRSAYDARASA